jgi:hypothetical protein
MKLRPVAVGAVLVTIALSGCGGNSSTSSSSTATTAAAADGTGSAPVSLPPGTPAALRGPHGVMLVAGELPGFVPAGYRPPATSPQSWVAEYPPAQRAPEATRLKALGFVAGIDEHLAPTKGGNGEAISNVEQFRSAKGATAEVAAQVNQALGRHETPFGVAGIPGAHGWGFSPSSMPDANIEFAVGPYYYLIGFGASAAIAPTHAQLIAAAQSLYRRVPR